MEEKQAFEQWATLELFGHKKLAGKISEQVIGGCSFVRVDVPRTAACGPFTKLFGQGAIYGILFVDEETAMAAAVMMAEKPIDEWSARKMIEGLPAAPCAGRLVDAEFVDPFSDDDDEAIFGDTGEDALDF